MLVKKLTDFIGASVGKCLNNSSCISQLAGSTFSKSSSNCLQTSVLVCKEYKPAGCHPSTPFKGLGDTGPKYLHVVTAPFW